MINFTKSQPAPASLATEGYNTKEVLDRLEKDFSNKCYLCEQKAPTVINVEHFIPHRGDENVKLDWNNLFWACEHCNNTKEIVEKGQPSVQRFLNCTKSDQEVLNWIKYRFVPIAHQKVVLENNCQNPHYEEFTKNTIHLLDKIYNGSTDLKTKQAENLKKLLKKELWDFMQTINEYCDDETKDQEKPDLLKSIEKNLSKKSAFTAFKRWIVMENEALKTDFEKYFD